MTFPTAYRIATAIVAACRETGENPLDIESASSMRARHYAMHAMHRVFPNVRIEALAKWVGCKGDPRKFFENSVQQKFKPINVSGTRRAAWWNESAFLRVIAAVQAVPKPTVPIEIAQTVPASDPPPKPAPPPRRAPIKLSARYEGSIVEPTRPAAAPGKGKLLDMLAEAVRNTANMPIPQK